MSEETLRKFAVGGVLLNSEDYELSREDGCDTYFTDQATILDVILSHRRPSVASDKESLVRRLAFERAGSPLRIQEVADRLPDS